jgi:hypothetical protein
MNAKPKRKARNPDRDTFGNAQREEALDDALKNTFPASDPVSIEQPAPRAPNGETSSEDKRPRK